MTNDITITRFHVNRKSYAQQDAYLASKDYVDEQTARIDVVLDHFVAHSRAHADQPRGWHFGRWKNTTDNKAGNLIASDAIVLEYPKTTRDRLREKVRDLGWHALLIETEDRAASRMTISVAFLLAEPLDDQKKYARLASVLAAQLDEYEMEHGCLAATHIVHAYRSTAIEALTGRLLNAQAYVVATKDDFQNLDARKFENRRPARAAAIAQLEAPRFTQTDDLFAWPENQIERLSRKHAERIAQISARPRPVAR